MLARSVGSIKLIILNISPRSYLVVFLNKAELVGDAELLDLVELELRELLTRQGFPGETTPIIRGSALKALAGDRDELGVPAIVRLVAEMDRYIPLPDRAVDGPFLLPIEEVYSICGRGTVVTGKIERGVIGVNDEIEIVGFRPTLRTTCTSIEIFRKIVDEGRAGDNAGLLLRGVKREEVERGQVLASPGSITPHTHFECEVYVLTKEEGGRHTPFPKGYQPQFFFDTTDVTGAVTPQQGIELVMPGDTVKVHVELISPVALEVDQGITLREGGKTVAAGTVLSILR